MKKGNRKLRFKIIGLSFYYKTTTSDKSGSYMKVLVKYLKSAFVSLTRNTVNQIFYVSYFFLFLQFETNDMDEILE